VSIKLFLDFSALLISCVADKRAKLPQVRSSLESWDPRVGRHGKELPWYWGRKLTHFQKTEMQRQNIWFYQTVWVNLWCFQTLEVNPA